MAKQTHLKNNSRGSKRAASVKMLDSLWHPILGTVKQTSCVRKCSSFQNPYAKVRASVQNVCRCCISAHSGSNYQKAINSEKVCFSTRLKTNKLHSLSELNISYYEQV